MFSQPLINSVGLLILGAVLSFLAARYWHQKSQAEALLVRVTELERDRDAIKATVDPITTAFQSLLIRQLTHFHTPEMDALMVKIGPPNTLTSDEASRLAVLLEERAKNMAGSIPDSERRAAHILPDVMILAKLEQDAVAQDSVLQVVAVPKGSANDKHAAGEGGAPPSEA
jgi:hypothetical protein